LLASALSEASNCGQKTLFVAGIVDIKGTKDPLPQEFENQQQTAPKGNFGACLFGMATDSWQRGLCHAGHVIEFWHFAPLLCRAPHMPISSILQTAEDQHCKGQILAVETRTG